MFWRLTPGRQTKQAWCQGDSLADPHTQIAWNLGISVSPSMAKVWVRGYGDHMGIRVLLSNCFAE